MQKTIEGVIERIKSHLSRRANAERLILVPNFVPNNKLDGLTLEMHRLTVDLGKATPFLQSLEVKVIATLSIERVKEIIAGHGQELSDYLAPYRSLDLRADFDFSSLSDLMEGVRLQVAFWLIGKSAGDSELLAGTLVYTEFPDITKISEWTSIGWSRKRWGVAGHVIKAHHGHGLYYEVKHLDGTTGGYDPIEISVVPG